MKTFNEIKLTPYSVDGKGKLNENQITNFIRVRTTNRYIF
jgi:hypothetical protein